jgi:hypothetical protein
MMMHSKATILAFALAVASSGCCSAFAPSSQTSAAAAFAQQQQQQKQRSHPTQLHNILDSKLEESIRREVRRPATIIYGSNAICAHTPETLTPLTHVC